MPDFLNSSASRVVLAAAVVLVVAYLSPFLISPVLRVVVSLWGFLLGYRKRKDVLFIYTPTSTSGTTPGPTQTPGANQAAANAAVVTVADSEFKMLEDGLTKQNARLKAEIDELNQKIDEWKKGFADSRARSKDGIAKKAFDNTAERLNEETGKNILLLIVVVSVLLFDTIIARQIFRSFGVGVEVFEFGEISVEHAWIFGLFTTVIAALILHIFWERGKFKTFLKSRYSFAVGGILILIIFMLRVATFTTDPDVAKSLVEILMIVCWLGGVLAVYWLLGEITGEQNKWFNILVAIFAPLILVLLILFGWVLLLEFIAHWGVTHIVESWFALRAARKKQMIHNNEISHNAQRSGFYRGLTM
ncbi:MAG: septum formation initiator family protein [Acidobacteria bacterium]|nr:septum formation initiator family protein [Acidobacteriota bacterium]